MDVPTGTAPQILRQSQCKAALFAPAESRSVGAKPIAGYDSGVSAILT